MPTAVETRHLMLLAVLDEVGTLHAAARRLHLSPSALSQQLRELEDRLGGPLFHRRWRRLITTEAGRRLTQSAHVVLGELARAESDTRSLLDGASGSIRFTTVCHQSYRWLPALLRAFAAGWPRVEVTVVPSAAGAVPEWLLARMLDVALVVEETDPDPRLRVEPLFRDELVALVGRRHAWSRRRWVPIEALAAEHVWSDEGAFRGHTALGRALAAAGGLRPRKVFLVPTTGGVPLEMARAGLGITILPHWTVRPLLTGRTLRAVRLGAKGLWLDWSVATRAEDPEPALAAFLQALRRHHPRARRVA